MAIYYELWYRDEDGELIGPILICPQQSEAESTYCGYVVQPKDGDLSRWPHLKPPKNDEEKT